MYKSHIFKGEKKGSQSSCSPSTPINIAGKEMYLSEGVSGWKSLKLVGWWFW